MNQNRNQIVSLIFVNSGTYNPMVNRPYETTADPQSLLKLYEVSDGGKLLNETTMGRVARNILKPNAKHAGFANIVNGWNEKRLMFLMEIHTDDMGIRRRHFISGYTDHPGYTVIFGNRTAYDPNMNLYINNHITCADTVNTSSIGNVGGMRLLSANRILHGQTTPQFTPNYGGMVIGNVPMRPRDVMSRVDQLYLSQVNNNATVLGTDEVFTSVKSSSIANDKPSAYLSKTLTAIRDAQAQANPDEDTVSSIMANAKTSVAESEVVTDPLFYQFRNYANSFFNTRSIAFRELVAMQPNLDDLIQHFGHTQAQRKVDSPLGVSTAPHSAGSTQSWEGGQQTTIAATIINQSTPALMSECLMMGVGISVSNCVHIPGAMRVDTPNGPFSVIINKALAFGGLDLVSTGLLTSFAKRFVNEIAYDVSHHGGIGVTIHATMSLGITENNIQIQMDGQNWETYNAPAFCDSMFSPVMANSMSSLDVLARDFSAMSDAITTQFNPLTYGFQSAPQPQRINDSLNQSMGTNNVSTSTKFVI